jgi:hypothetical protein
MRRQPSRAAAGALLGLLATVFLAPGVRGAPPAPAPAPAYPHGAVVALRGTPHIWVAGPDGVLHWAGDTRALGGRPVDWGSRHEVSLDELRRSPRGDPLLAAGLVKLGAPIYLAKWETDQAAPTLLHIRSIADVALFGIDGGNYGRFVVDRAAWEQRFGFDADALPKGVLAPAGAQAPACAGPPAGAEGVRLCLPPGLGTGVQGRREPRTAELQPGAQEAHRLLTVQGYPVATPLDLPVLAVFALADFDQPGAYLAPDVRALRRVLAERPPFRGTSAFPPDTVNLPVTQVVNLPALLFGAVGVFLARPLYLDLPWGTGVRGVGQIGQDLSPLLHRAIQYHFAGTSADGRWLVVASFPLSAPDMPPVSPESLDRDWAGALAVVHRHLSLLDESRYAPTLPTLDDLLRSLTIEGP